MLPSPQGWHIQGWQFRKREKAPNFACSFFWEAKLVLMCKPVPHICPEYPGALEANVPFVIRSIIKQSPGVVAQDAPVNMALDVRATWRARHENDDRILFEDQRLVLWLHPSHLVNAFETIPPFPLLRIHKPVPPTRFAEQQIFKWQG